MMKNFRAVASLMVAVAAYSGSGSANQERSQHHKIEGRESPESIPAHIKWEHFFQTMKQIAYGEGLDEASNRIDALAKYNLLIPEPDVRVVLEVAENTITRMGALRKPFDDEHAGLTRLQWTEAQRHQRADEIQSSVLRGRDELKRRLPRSSFTAVMRYLNKVIVPGITYYRR